MQIPVRHRVMRGAMSLASGLILLQAGGCAVDTEPLFTQLIQLILAQLIGGFVQGSFNLV